MEQDFEERGVFFPAFMGAVIGGLIVGGLFMWFGGGSSDDPEELMAKTYMAEVATHVSPTSVRHSIEIEDEERIIVDLRSVADYERGHIVTAVNIPASTLLEGMLVEEFKALPEGKEIVLYCYSTSCMLSAKTAGTLAQNGIFVQYMTIGWNEWRYDWNMWNGQFVDTNPLQYSAVGSEPGIHTGPKSKAGCAAGGSEGC